jgi:lipid-A-disaccharide synthase
VRIFVGAGEASGDRILAALLQGLRLHFPEMELRGFGGPFSTKEGLTSPYSLTDLAVNGVGDVLRRGAFLWRARRSLLRELQSFRPDLVVLVDYPGMNIMLARHARRLGIPVHFVAPPQLWAYRNPARRRARLQRDLDQTSLQFLFPFEINAYEPWSAARKPTLLQGHFFSLPAFETPGGTRLLLCPGSRLGVLRRNLPLWLERAQAFFGTLEGVDVLVPEYLAKEARALCGAAAGLKILTDKEDAFARAGAAIAFPGTMTLELFLQRALRGPPYQNLALPNAISGQALLPEWVGTVGDFRRHPPEIPDHITVWNPEATVEAVHDVWMRMGSNAGVAVGVDSCVRIAREKPADTF